MMQSLHFLKKNKKGQDSWELFKWFPRIFTLLIIVLFCYYLFISFWDIDYDTKTARSAAVHPKILHGLIFSYSDENCAEKEITQNTMVSCAISRPNRIYLNNFNHEKLSDIMYYQDNNPTDKLVTIHTAPLSAKLTLQLETDEDKIREEVLYVNERDFKFYTEQLGLDPNRYGLTESITSVIVIDESSFKEYRGMLKIEVIVP